MAPQLALFEAARYHDPRVAADRARARSLAKLRPVRRCERSRPSEDTTVVVLRRSPPSSAGRTAA